MEADGGKLFKGTRYASRPRAHRRYPPKARRIGNDDNKVGSRRGHGLHSGCQQIGQAIQIEMQIGGFGAGKSVWRRCDRFLGKDRRGEERTVGRSKAVY